MIAPVMPVYRRSDIVMKRGEGCYLFDDSGKRYLDFATGIAVNALGHGHPHVVQALKAQADALWHCSNMYRIPGQERLAERLVEASFAETVFFCSSGGEAVECGLKMIRRYHHSQGSKRYRILTFEGGFHGRSFAGISAGGNEKAREGYYPLLEGFDRVAYNDLESAKAAITDKTAGILLEAIQGEGGVHSAAPEFLQGLRQLCDEKGLLLMLDEVQCGMGRSGALFGFEASGIRPDIVSVAKGIGNGFPLGALLANEKAASCMTPGSHGSTYGSNPLAMAVGNAVLDVMMEPDFMKHVQEMGVLLLEKLATLVEKFPDQLEEVRGRGLMIGIKTRISNYALADRLRNYGLLTSPTAGDAVIRILPPLVVQAGQIDEAIEILTRCLSEGDDHD